MSEGLCAEYADEHRMVDALRRVRALGIARLDGHSPYPVPAAVEALGLGRSRTGWWTLIGGVLGSTSTYAFQWWAFVVDYPLDSGGRPLHGFLTFVPLTFEVGLLCAAVATFAAWFAHTRLPAHWDAVFEVDGFDRASVDRFFVAVDGRDPAFDDLSVRAALHEAGALAIHPLGAP
jgi:hypothetical protein